MGRKTNALITRKSPYKVLRKWFMDNMDRFPSELKAGFIVYPNVKKTIELNISQIDNEINNSSRDVRYSALAKSSKYNLFELHKTLSDNGYGKTN